MKSNIPCYKCERRNATCHGSCEEYMEFFRNNEKLKAEKRKQIDTNNMFAQIKQENFLKRRRR